MAAGSGEHTASPARQTHGARLGWRLFHAVKSQDAQARDFRSSLGRGAILLSIREAIRIDDAETVRRAAGVSCFETRDQARNAAVRFRLGRFVAEIFIPDDDCAIE